MDHWTAMYRYEWKKLGNRRTVRCAVIVMILATVYMIVGGPLSTAISGTDGDGVYTIYNGIEWNTLQKEITEPLNGRAVDDMLLREVQEAYQGVYRQEYTVASDTGSGMEYQETVTTETTDVGGREGEEESEGQQDQEIYLPIYQYVRELTGYYDAIHTVDAASLYQARVDHLLKPLWSELGLTREEIAYQTVQEDKVKKPFVYGYAQGWDHMLEAFVYLHMILLLGIAVSLADLFTSEYHQKTDQLILCSRYGRKQFFYAKIAVGVTYAAACGAVMLLVLLLSAVCVYGPEGGDIAVQIYRPLCSRTLSMAQAVFLMGGICIALCILDAVLVMFLSETVRSAAAVMGIMVCAMLGTIVVQIPVGGRVVSQIWEMLPARIMNTESLWDGRLVLLGGIAVTNYGAALMLYLAAGMVLLLCGRRRWRRAEK